MTVQILRIIAFAPLLFSLKSLAAMGSISGGGSLPSYSQPAEDFQYECKLTYTQSMPRPSDPYCNGTFVSSATLKKQPTIFGDVGTVEMKDLKFTNESGRGGACGKAPVSLNGSNLYIAVYDNRENRGQGFLTSVVVKVADPYHSSNFGSGTSTVDYQASFVETKAQLRSGNMEVSLAAKCSKLITETK